MWNPRSILFSCAKGLFVCAKSVAAHYPLHNRLLSLLHVITHFLLLLSW